MRIALPRWLRPWELSSRVERLGDAVDELNAKLEGVQARLTSLETPPEFPAFSPDSDALTRNGGRRPGSARTTYTPGSTPARAVASVGRPRSARDLVASYNDALRDTECQLLFFSEFQPMQIGVSNVLERRRNTDIDAVFHPASDGDYYAVPVGGQANRFVVVPRMGLSIQDAQYGPGAFGVVFDCVGYRPNERHAISALVRAALFERWGPDDWRLYSRGELTLRRD